MWPRLLPQSPPENMVAEEIDNFSLRLQFLPGEGSYYSFFPLSFAVFSLINPGKEDFTTRSISLFISENKVVLLDFLFSLASVERKKSGVLYTKMIAL